MSKDPGKGAIKRHRRKMSEKNQTKPAGTYVGLPGGFSIFVPEGVGLFNPQNVALATKVIAWHLKQEEFKKSRRNNIKPFNNSGVVRVTLFPQNSNKNSTRINNHSDARQSMTQENNTPSPGDGDMDEAISLLLNLRNYK